MISLDLCKEYLNVAVRLFQAAVCVNLCSVSDDSISTGERSSVLPVPGVY